MHDPNRPGLAPRVVIFDREPAVPIPPAPMYGDELLELLVDLGLDPAVLASFELAATPNAIGPEDPVEGIVSEYVFDPEGFVLTDDEGAPLKRRRVVVLRSLRSSN